MLGQRLNNVIQEENRYDERPDWCFSHICFLRSDTGKAWWTVRQYKKSIYNILISKGEKTYLWNTFSGVLLSLDCEGKAFYDGYEWENSNSPFFHTLLEQGCIVDSRLDEVGRVLFGEKSIMMNPFPQKQYYGFLYQYSITCWFVQEIFPQNLRKNP